ncbi:cytochrome c biogenesis protein [Desulfuromonas thiophila]|uniref:Cytochrome c biogenesis protein n=1 Tax=Desulfuromonas thiophila TaxID=57664 RepID=A0A1G6YH10_9BACT|nr:cytochrome c biogenesis protein [Desulfuromonas thiophila]
MSGQQRTVVAAIWDFFCSLKLSIFTLIVLAITSIIGTVIQQNRPAEEYLRFFSEKTYHLLNSLQFFDMYHSWWFIGLLILFSINLVCCSIKRLPRVWKLVRHPQLTPSEALLKSFSNVDEQLVTGSLAEVRQRMEAFVAREFAPPVCNSGEAGLYLYADKSRYARLGVYVTHLSILIIFIGAIIGNLFGYKAFVNIPEGGSVDQVWLRSGGVADLGFSVTCEDFSVSFYDNSQRPKEYRSLLTIKDGGEVVIDKRPVIVNDPLSYKGITFYQSSYGPAGGEVLSVKVKLRGTDKAQAYALQRGERALLPDDTRIQLVDFTPSFRNFGPAARLQVQPASAEAFSVTLFKNFPDFDDQRGGEHIFTLEDFEQKYYTGLQATKDPGVWVVWLGCTLLVLGSLVAFFLSHRRLWVVLSEKQGKVRVRLVGSAHRNQPAFELYFDRLKEAFRKELA